MGLALIKKTIYESADLALEEGLILNRKLFFESIRSDDAMNIMRLYVSAGQDPEKLAAMVEELEKSEG
ncbi:MAG: hypothetical protein JRI33_06045 [Deltaproteobacteria bacterium]|nr:hypothetical protein [Deltaproteobacteria bacterium]